MTGRPASSPPPEPVEDALAPTPAAEVAADVDEVLFRHVLGHFATGVTVVAGVHDGQPVGLSVNSFTSVSLAPPLVAFCAARSSSTWPRLRSVGTFCVSILADEQEDLARLFARQGADKFDGVDWEPAPSGAPVLGGSLAWVDCRVAAEHDGGDHVLVVGTVLDLGVAQAGAPLIFYRGGYGRFAG